MTFGEFANFVYVILCIVHNAQNVRLTSSLYYHFVTKKEMKKCDFYISIFIILHFLVESKSHYGI